VRSALPLAVVLLALTACAVSPEPTQAVATVQVLHKGVEMSEAVPLSAEGGRVEVTEKIGGCDRPGGVGEIEVKGYFRQIDAGVENTFMHACTAIERCRELDHVSSGHWRAVTLTVGEPKYSDCGSSVQLRLIANKSFQATQ
jgi:hypothetical protein